VSFAWALATSFSECRDEYPLAEPGALLSEPLEAAGRDRCATPVAVASSRNNSKDHNFFAKFIDFQDPWMKKARPEYHALSPSCPDLLRSFIKKLPFVTFGSRSRVSPVGDRRKRQTFAATPAEPGDLPWGVGL
jgi:hypothetical protein